MSGETKTGSKIVDWKKLPVNDSGKNWQDLHNEVVRLTKNHGIDEYGRDQSTQSSGDTRGMGEARQIHDTLRAWEKQKEKEKIIEPEDRVHHHAMMGLGARYMVSAPGDGYKPRQTTTRKEKPVVYLGGKKRKTKRKKTKRKKRKTKRRKKTRKHKRRKRRKTRRR